MSSLSSMSPSLMYLVTKMLISLVLAGLAGLLIGWALGKIGNQRRTHRIEDEWRNTLADSEEDHARVVSRFKKSNQALDDENNNLRTKIAALNSKIDTNREEVERARLQQQQLNSRVESGQSEIDSITQRLNEERAKNHKLQNLTKALKSSSDQKDRLNQQLNQELDGSRQQLQNLQAVENDDSYIALQREVAELRAVNKENADLRERVATESREREDAVSEVYRLKQDNEVLEKEREDFRRWSLKLEQEQAGFDERVQGAVSEALRNDGVQATDLELEVARLRPMVSSLNSEIEQLQQKNQQLQAAQHQGASTNHNATSSGLRELQTAFDQISFERDQLRTRLADQERQTASLSARASTGANQGEVDDLRKQVAQLSAEKGLMAATIDELKQGGR
jgi:chromosome segregation ATPase